MASPRKSASRSRAVKPAKKKPARSARPAAKARTRPARPAHHAKAKAKERKVLPAHKPPVAKKPAPVKTKSRPVPRVISPPANKKAAPAPPAASKKAPSRPKAVARPPAPLPEVRPLGVLPPESRARGIERSVSGAAPRLAVGRPASQSIKSQGVERVTEKDLKEFELRLLGERQRLMKEMGHLENTVLKVNPRDSAGDLSGYSFHMADAGTDAYEREKAFQFASTEGRLLMELNEALRRLYSGTYGICESCGNPIAKVRLEAVPQARLCRDCKQKEEERENRPAQ